MSEVKYCKDCKWFVDDGGVFGIADMREFGHCKHPEAVEWWSRVTQRDGSVLVTGPREPTRFLPYASVERMSFSGCGEKAVRFEPIDPTHVPAQAPRKRLLIGLLWAIIFVALAAACFLYSVGKI